MHTLHISAVQGMWLACLPFGERKHTSMHFWNLVVSNSDLVEHMAPVNLLNGTFVCDSC